MIWHIDSALLRTIFSVLSLIGLVIFINPILLGICNLGNVSASIAFLLLSIFFIFNKTIASLLDRLWMHSIGKIIIITVIGFIILGLILVTIISAFMINAANDYPEESNIVVVLGCKVNGTTPSLMLTKRLEATYDYLIENEDVLVIVSGGQGEYEDISEAQCMKDYLIGKGISDDRIIMEDKSTSTYENILFSKQIMSDMELGNNITIITDGFHQLRAKMIANKLDVETDSVSAKTPIYLLPTYWVREWFGVIVEYVK